nr:MAG TPA: hypothetical protein [Caudoviricetes sp.]
MLAIQVPESAVCRDRIEPGAVKPRRIIPHRHQCIIEQVVFFVLWNQIIKIERNVLFDHIQTAQIIDVASVALTKTEFFASGLIDVTLMDSCCFTDGHRCATSLLVRFALIFSFDHFGFYQGHTVLPPNINNGFDPVSGLTIFYDTNLFDISVNLCAGLRKIGQNSFLRMFQII